MYEDDPEGYGAEAGCEAGGAERSSAIEPSTYHRRFYTGLLCTLHFAFIRKSLLEARLTPLGGSVRHPEWSVDLHRQI